MSQFYKHFALNTEGRDFIVTDIHGCFDHLRDMLQEAKFDVAKDRLFCGGDLVDRGPDSLQALEWLDQPWFHSVRGNHDQMAIDADLGTIDRDLYIMNGGRWWFQLAPEDQHRMGQRFACLPFAIDVDTPQGLIGIVHAEPVGNDWKAFTEMLQEYDEGVFFQATWARDRIRYKITDRIENVEKVYVGHTPVYDPTILGNVHYIDTGKVYGRKMTLICLHTDEVWQR